MEISWEKSEEFIKAWMAALMEGIDEYIDEETKVKIFRKTGRVCAEMFALNMFKQIWDKTGDLKSFCELCRKNHLNFTLKDDEIHIEYPHCYCSFPKLNFINSPSLCYCSPGWVKANLEGSIGGTWNVERVCSALNDENNECNGGCRFIARQE